jgi:fatty acid desaturase
VTQAGLAVEGSASGPSLPYAVTGVARNVAFYSVALAAVPTVSAANPWWAIALMPFLGLSMYRLTMVMHDCLHGTLFASQPANRLCGIAAGAMSGIEFHAFARLHWAHHRHTGEPGDPQGSDYLSLPGSRGGIARHLLLPLSGYTHFKVWLVMRALPRGRRRFAVLALAPLIVVQGSAAYVASSGMAYWWLAPLPILSAATFGLFFAQLRGFAEHVAMPEQSPEGNVRSHEPTLVDRLLLHDLNFNYHREHHLHPNVPSCRLPELHRRLAAARPAEFTLAPGMFATIRRRLAAAKSGTFAMDGSTP